MKSKKGQILVLILIIMAMGLIIISPFLSYLSSSYNLYTAKNRETMAYYAVDAMMSKIFSDMYAGEDVYILNRDEPGRYSPEGEFLNRYAVRTSIDNSIENPPPPPSGGIVDWIYIDPGCAQGLNSLAYNATHEFKAYLTENTSVTVNWYFRDSSSPTWCNYFCIGRMWIEDETFQVVAGSADADLTNGTSTAFQQQITYTVPEGETGIYTIKFRNRSYRERGLLCLTTQTRSMANMTVKPTFSGTGDEQYTWVRIGGIEGGQIRQYQDYTIEVTASLRGKDITTITANVRQTPGPLIWWDTQSIAVVSWIVVHHR